MLSGRQWTSLHVNWGFLMMAEPKSRLELLVTLVQVVSIVSGVVFSVLSFNATREKEVDVRNKEAEARRTEAERPLRELRRSVYLEAVKTAAVIATPEGRSSPELSKARRRFRELYVAELTMVEDPAVEATMVALARAVDPDLLNLNAGQQAALNLAKALRSSYANPLSASEQK
jgi:hypothetical protein